MFNKVIDVKNLPVINLGNENYIFAGQKLWREDEYIGSSKTLPKMNSAERLILKYDSSIKKNRVIAIYSKQNSWAKVKIIPLELVATLDGEQKNYVIREKEKIRELYEVKSGALLGEIFIDETIDEQIVIRTSGHLAGTVSCIIKNLSQEQQLQEQTELLAFIEGKLGKKQVPDLDEIIKNDKVNGEEVLRTLKNLLIDRSFDENYLKLLNFKPGEFLTQVIYYLDLLISLEQADGKFKTARSDHFQKAITLAIYKNIGYGRERAKNNVDYENKLISIVLKQGLKSFLKMTKQEESLSVEKNRWNTSEKNHSKKTEDEASLITKTSNDKRHKYYWKRNLYVEVPAEQKEKANRIIEYLTAQKKVASGSPEKLTGVIKFIFDERGYKQIKDEHYKLIVGLEKILLGRKVKPGVDITHSSLLSFFRTLANAFDLEYFETPEFADELKRSLLLTLIDVNYCQKAMQPGGFLYKYVPTALTAPVFNNLPAVRLIYHQEVLKLIEQDKEIKDPFDLFFE